MTTVASTLFNAALALSLTGLPTGMTASFAPTSLGAPGSGTSKLTLAAASNVAPGAYSLVITANGGGVAQKAGLTVNVPGFTLSASTSTASLRPGGKAIVTLATRALGGFNAAVALSVSGLPSGVSAGFGPASVAAPGNGSSALALKRGSGTGSGTSKVTVSAASGGMIHALTLTLSLASR